jgi:hypothetical protein
MKSPLGKKIVIVRYREVETLTNSCCCSDSQSGCAEFVTSYDPGDYWIEGEIRTAAGKVPVVSTKLTVQDTLGTWKARWGIKRMNYAINPGLYAVGTPSPNSPVLVTANYKLTFDTLRKELSGLQAWLLVLDTKGINVWCAAGKGTFGTKELMARIESTKLAQIIAHRTLILPQLGAPGVSAHVVGRQSGFNVVYGPVRAQDIPEFIRAGLKAAAGMREVRFTVRDRLVLTPMQLAGAAKTSLLIFGVLFLLNLAGIGPFGLTDFYAYAGALIVGCVITPVLLPWIPGRAFAWKGWLGGLFWAIAVNLLNGWPQTPAYSVVRALAYILILPSVAAFYAMDFTGSSTYTSLSGVLKEMKAAVPAIAVTISLGVILLIINSFI